MNADDARLREIIAEAMAQNNKQGMMGFGQDKASQDMYKKFMSDPKLLEAGAQQAGLMDEDTSLKMMEMGAPRNIPDGGRLGWTEALSNGINSGLGMYNLLNAQKVKANALRAMKPNGSEEPVAEAFPVSMSNPVGRPLPPLA